MSVLIAHAQLDVPSSTGSLPLLTLSQITEPLAGLLTNGFHSLCLEEETVENSEPFKSTV